MSVVFEDNSSKMASIIEKGIKNCLEEIAGECEDMAKRNSRVDTGKTRGSYSHKVIDKTAYVGSNDKNAIYEEFGTGQYALKGNGRKGTWKYKDAKGQWHITSGKTPNRPLERARTEITPKAKKHYKEVLEKLKNG